MRKHNFEFLFFTITLKTLWNIVICTFILSIVLFGCAPKISEIHPISSNFEDQNKLKVVILTELTSHRQISTIALKKYNNINRILIYTFDKEKFKIVLNPINRVDFITKKDYYIDAGKKLNVDYIIHIQYADFNVEPGSTIETVSYKIWIISKLVERNRGKGHGFK